MSTYQELKGLKVKYLSSDTSGDRIKEGEVFYNSTDFNLKAFVSTSAWHSSGSLSLARRGVTGAGTQTAGLASGGGTPDPATVATEEYNGTGWAVGGDLNTGATFAAAAGTQTAGLKFGGATPQNVEFGETEEYNGTSWTESGDIGATQTSSIVFGGHITPNPSGYQQTEEFTGETTALNLKTITDS